MKTRLRWSDACRIIRPCPHGFYCKPFKLDDEIFWPSPKACPRGKLCDQMNLSAPLPCPKGYFCLTSLLKQECALGFHCPEDTYVPKLCASLVQDVAGPQVEYANRSSLTGPNLYNGL